MLDVLKRVTFPARRTIAGAIYPVARRFDSRARASYSWCGEDLVALSWLLKDGFRVDEIRYLDIGAADPIAASNTYLMWTMGASGVLVEPDPDQAEKLRKARPRDIVVNVGAAFDERQTGALARFEIPLLNTFSASRAATIVDGETSRMIDRVEIDLVPINAIIERYLESQAPHFLSIDTESCDLKILSLLDLSRFRPRVICVELSSSRQEYESLLCPHGYSAVCQTPDNLIFKR